MSRVNEETHLLNNTPASKSVLPSMEDTSCFDDDSATECDAGDADPCDLSSGLDASFFAGAAAFFSGAFLGAIYYYFFFLIIFFEIFSNKFLSRALLAGIYKTKALQTIRMYH
jgi:hypothetical protein